MSAPRQKQTNKETTVSEIRVTIDRQAERAERTVTEGTTTPITFNEAPKAAAAGTSTPVEPGTVQVEEDVTVTYAIACRSARAGAALTPHTIS